jgi:hypothetical protein
MLTPADTFGSSLKTALGQINAIDKITSKDNAAHANDRRHFQGKVLGPF